VLVINALLIVDHRLKLRQGVSQIDFGKRGVVFCWSTSAHFLATSSAVRIVRPLASLENSISAPPILLELAVTLWNICFS
jgi:hypothetical protein